MPLQLAVPDQVMPIIYADGAPFHRHFLSGPIRKKVLARLSIWFSATLCIRIPDSMTRITLTFVRVLTDSFNFFILFPFEVQVFRGTPTSGGYGSGAAANSAKWFSSRPNVARVITQNVQPSLLSTNLSPKMSN